ncbi:hypothetical protein [Marinobacter mangrovi]|uniref:hypothetical protein n=1 Tax=Marinobacter mangrovi TaxID=2803918 RepID=UPI00193491D8|nr:hypothetical protein [Marinobacter mangrovi]
MKTSGKSVLLIIFTVSFAAPIFLLGFGIVVGTPYSLTQIFRGSFELALYPFISIGGLLGLWAVLQLLARTLNDSFKLASPARLLVYICSGIFSLGAVAINTEMGFGISSLFWIMPCGLTGYLVYVNRQYFRDGLK